MISQKLLDILACPLCKADVKLEGEKLICTNNQCNCRYSVKDDIPIMLIDEADRPCPSCATQRQWQPDKDTVKCPKCGAAFQYVRK
jgi:uncharacterized protein YbaR (Trm112 family)